MNVVFWASVSAEARIAVLVRSEANSTSTVLNRTWVAVNSTSAAFWTSISCDDRAEFVAPRFVICVPRLAISAFLVVMLVSSADL